MYINEDAMHLVNNEAKNVNSNETVYIYQVELEAVLSPSQVFHYFEMNKGYRYIFRNKEGSETLIGIGHARLFNYDHLNPKGVTQDFDLFNNQCHIHGALDRNLIRLFGGFYFDESDSAYFDTFDKSMFVIPEIQVILKDNKTYISFVNKERDGIDKVIKALQKLSCNNNDAANDSMTFSANQDEPYELIQKKDIDLTDFKENVVKAVNKMNEGAFKKVVLSRKKKLKLNQSVNNDDMLTKALNTKEKSYFVLFENKEKTFLSRTPEQLLMVNDGVLYTNAIAGTMDKAESEARSVLLNDEKNLGEHDIVVQSIVADIQPYCDSINFKGTPDIMENQFFYHLYTPIRAHVKEGALLEMVEALHPTPALGGYPKKEAAAFLHQLHEARGLYGAPIGCIDTEGNGEFVVAIRSMIYKDDEAVLFAGCGIVKDSKVENEVHETEIKFKPMLDILGVLNNE